MLEDEHVPAPLLLRAPGKPTLGYQVPLGTWACLVPMCLFYPAIAPAPSTSSREETRMDQGAADMEVDGAEGPTSSEAGAAHVSSAAASAVAAEATAAAPRAGPASAIGTVPDSAAAVAGTAGNGTGDAEGPAVDELPMAERQYFQAQQRGRLEAGDTGRPPLAAYLPLASVGLMHEGAASGGAEEALSTRTPLDQVRQPLVVWRCQCSWWQLHGRVLHTGHCHGCVGIVAVFTRR